MGRYQGQGKEWAEQEIGLSIEVVHRRPKPTPGKVARIWFIVSPDVSQGPNDIE